MKFILDILAVLVFLFFGYLIFFISFKWIPLFSVGMVFLLGSVLILIISGWALNRLKILIMGKK